ncbi:MAG TPA: protein translocase subunit SecD [Gemmataceae bacterium]|nr:protein translocase subunit SecD [Gemmataceae bacterium]
MFKQFFWKIVLCVVPVLICLAIIVGGFVHSIQQVDEFAGIPLPRFKIGTDLAGGTILVYEIDSRKLVAAEGGQAQDPKAIAQNLAEKLKARIDPNDLYNVVIRPAGGEGRVEIILPTGTTGSAEKFKAAWDELLAEMEKEYKLPPKSLKVPRGQVQKLAEKILQLVQQKIWEEKLYATPESKKELMDRAMDSKVKGGEEPQYLAPLYDIVSRERRAVAELFMVPYVVATKPENYVSTKALQLYDPAAKTFFNPNKKLRELVKDVKDLVDDNRKSREIDAWFKQQAWRKMIGMMLDQKGWEILKSRKAAFEKIAPDAVDELVGRVVTKGDGVGQSFMVVMETLIGPDSLKSKYVDVIEVDDKGKAKDESTFINADKVLEFIKENYGPSAQMVEEKIEKANKEHGFSRDLTVEEVQRIKDLVSKVGSLEFRILANSVDDKEAIKEAIDMINNSDNDPPLKAELEEAQNNGTPPPPPRFPKTKIPKTFDIPLRGGASRVTYQWVELGPQERQQLGLSNFIGQETDRRSWNHMFTWRKKATQIPLTSSEGGDQKMLQGALFYSRPCTDRNLPEEERRRKKVEYFVLTRNPEIDIPTGKETPKIDGSYLVNAANHPDSSGRPAVSFTFNAAGGDLFRQVTRKNIPTGEGSLQVKRHLAIILDGLVMSAPTINSEIERSGQISGSFSNKEVDQLVNILRAGALPATLKPQPVSENTMGPTLGYDTTIKGLIAIVVAFVVVLLFMIVYYRFAGLVASVALLANLILTVGFMLAVKATFTLPGLAGLVLMLGMAVDANILIYERLREERDRGASILLALRNGYDRAFGTIIDTHLSSIFTAIVLYIVGNDQLKGFGVTLTVGLLISLFTSLFMTRLIFDLWAAKGWLTKLSMLRFFTRPDIDFMALRYYLFAATGILTILGGALFIGRLPYDLNIDFVGGTAYSGQLAEGHAKTDEELRELVGAKNKESRLANKARAEEKDQKGNRYALWFDDGTGKAPEKPLIIALANTPEGDTPEKRAANVAKRAEDLPDATVELFMADTGGDQQGGKTQFFTVRTTEKEPELVQATLDRLLQYKDEKTGQWTPLLKKVFMDYDEVKDGKETRVRFYGSTADGKMDKDNPVLASPSFVTTLLTRQLMDVFKVDDRNQLTFTFELSNADDEQSGDGRFKVADLAFAGKTTALSAEDIYKINQALKGTKQAFNSQPTPERLETFDSGLAAETRLRAMYAILLSWAAILLYLWFRFGSWTFGLAAVLCLIHDLFFTLGVIAMCHYVNMIFPGILGIQDFKIDLPAVAALLTLVGYSVNDTIVVFDRIREVRGKNPDLTPQIINDSVNQTLSRTLLASLTTWLVVIVLYIFGGPGVHLFAFVMVVGVVVGTYSSIYVASPLLLLFGEGHAPGKTPTAGPTPTVTGPDVRIQAAPS